ncbi:MAG: 3-oxoacyl-ACP reductase FabG [Planctomycetes bacterium]|nr:3-oxoacyl-ACP reductase FabG [Planctomycetota bacterium]
MAPEFQDRVALVTGGSRGIGRACAENIAAAGAAVAVNYHSAEQAARETVALIESEGGRAMAIHADVSLPDDVERMVAEVERTLGPIDLLVNNAGVFDHVTHRETTLELWNRTLAVNLTGVYLVTWEVKEGMLARRFGRIVNIASIAGLRPRPNCIAYAASKAGVISFTKSVAEAWARDGLRVNAIAPGLIDTEILDGVDQQRLDELVASTPIPRMGRPQEIAELAVFLLSERSSFMTGQTLVASGGRVMLP